MGANLQLAGLKKKLRGRWVLDGVDLDIAPGRSLVLIGGSGQGKSVTLKCTLGLMKPDAGQVLVDGQDVTRLHGAARTAAVHRLEIPYGRFERNIRLPAQLLTLDRSELVNGCLVIRLGKA